MVSMKTDLLLDNNMKTILCIGEDLYSRKSGRHLADLEGQLKFALRNVKPTASAELLIAYEPVWAIGTGESASNEQIVEAVKFIKSVVADLFGSNNLSQIKILYGGSVNLKNIASLLPILDQLEGFLIGGASLNVAEFFEICKITQCELTRT